MRQWLTPVLVGLAAAAGVLLWDPFAPEPAPPVEETLPPPGPLLGTTTPFDNVSAPATVIAVSDPGHLPPNGTGMAGPGMLYTFRNATPFLALARIVPADSTCPAGCGIGLRPATVEGPALLQGGHDFALLSVYVFDEVGSLLATNQNDTRFGAPSVVLPDGPWYLGHEAAPDDATAARSVGGGILRPYVDLLQGAQEGDIRSSRIVEHPYAGLVGPIYVTVRVDSVLA